MVGCSDEQANLMGCNADSKNSKECPVPKVTQKKGGAKTSESKVSELVNDSVSYLYELSLIRGHLWVGRELALAGHRELAIMHSKHPKDEIYSTLVDVFMAKGSKGFAQELEEFSEFVEEGSDVQIDNAYSKVVDSIHGNHREIVLEVKDLLSLIIRLTNQAAMEYAVGIIDERVDNVHEYQDARGFTEIAIHWMKFYEGKDEINDIEKSAIIRVRKKLEDGLVMWPSLTPQAGVPFNASRLFGLAADVEIISLSL